MLSVTWAFRTTLQEAPCCKSALRNNGSEKGRTVTSGDATLRVKSRQSSKQLLHHVAVHIRQAEVAALKLVGQPGVIDPQAV
jgi:hypothetical protein